MFDIKRIMHVFLAASLLGSATTAIASAASHPPAAGHGSIQRQSERDGDKAKRDPREDQRDQGDKGDQQHDKGDQQRDKGDQGDHSKPPA